MSEPNNDHENNIKVHPPLEHPNLETAKNQVASYKILSFMSYAPDEYKSLVMTGWLHSLKDCNDMFRLMDREGYYRFYPRYIESVLKRPNSKLKIAVLTEDEDIALGWSLEEGSILHYVFVPEIYRKNGIGSSLLPKKFDTITHITAPWLEIWHKKFSEVKYNPFV